jgi:hypothetical protein
MEHPTDTGQRTSPEARRGPTGYRGWSVVDTSQKVSAGYLNYPADVRDTTESGMGHRGNRHLRYLAEFISVNVGGSHRNAKASSLPMSDVSVGGVIVLGARESRVQGEGRQFVGIPTQSNPMSTRRNLR